MEKIEEARNIIDTVISDNALRVVRTVFGDPAAVMAKLDDRYISKTTASKISKTVKLVFVRYSSLKESMPRHVDKIAALVVQIHFMGTTLDETLVTGIIVASITVDELKMAWAAFKKFFGDKLKWKDVTARLIGEERSLKPDRRQSSRQATYGNKCCVICGETSHCSDMCFLDPLNKNNTLGLTRATVRNITYRGGNTVTNFFHKKYEKG